jgi:hypothetical protein
MKKTKAETTVEAPAPKKTVPLNLNGAEYRLGYSFNQIARTERDAGCNLLRGLTDLANLSALELTGLFLAGIRAADPASTMTLDGAAALIDYGTIYPITEALAESILTSVPPKPSKAEPKVTA